MLYHLSVPDDYVRFNHLYLYFVQVTQELGIDAPIHISMKLGDSSNAYNKIISAAEHPHLSIPETEYGRKRKQYHNNLIFASGVSPFS